MNLWSKQKSYMELMELRPGCLSLIFTWFQWFHILCVNAINSLVARDCWHLGGLAILSYAAHLYCCYIMLLYDQMAASTICLSAYIYTHLQELQMCQIPANTSTGGHPQLLSLFLVSHIACWCLAWVWTEGMSRNHWAGTRRNCMQEHLGTAGTCMHRIT